MNAEVNLDCNVSRETLNMLETYVSLLIKWNLRINLIGKSTVEEIWTRHINDSIQIWSIIAEDIPADKSITWLDIGSGGGLPAIVLAIIAQEKFPNLSFQMIESDQRKSTFLRTAIRETQCNAVVFSKRIEDVEPLNADIISARALAPLNDLLEMSQRHMKNGATLLFPKGKNWPDEVEVAKKKWIFSIEGHRSKTSLASAILEIGNLHNA